MTLYSKPDADYTYGYNYELPVRALLLTATQLGVT